MSPQEQRSGVDVVNAVLEYQPLVTRIVPYSAAYRDQVLELARMMLDESPTYHDAEINVAKLVANFNATIAAPNDAYLGLAVRGAAVIGFMFAVISETFFNTSREVYDQGWYVTPEQRGGRAAIMLVNDLERWGQEQGVYKFNLSQSSAVDINRTMKLMAHLGYRVTGYNAIKET